MINTDKIIEQLDKLFDENRMNQVEPFLTEKLIEAMEEEDTSAVLVLLNEMVGFFRSTNQYDKSLLYAQKAVDILKGAGMEGTVEYATTLLNQANAMRAAGRLEESIALYGETEQIYRKYLPADAFDFASLYNNLSLDYMEMEVYEEAVRYLEKALSIVERYGEEKSFELAVTHTNLGNCLLQLTGREEEAVSYLRKAVEYFEGIDLYDTHYGAAVMGIADVFEKKGEYGKAAEEYRKGLDAISRNLGFIEYYYRVKEKYDICVSKAAEHGISVGFEKGLALSRALWEEVLKPEFEKQLPEVMERAAVGLVGYGSDCYGYDDEISRDHDWGPAVCIWLSDEDFDAYGSRLQDLYDSLTVGHGFHGFVRQTSAQGGGRVGVLKLSAFLAEFLGKAFTDYLLAGVSQAGRAVVSAHSADKDLESVGIKNAVTALDGCVMQSEEFEELARSDKYISFMRSTDEVSLSAVVNGSLFEKGDGVFAALRTLLGRGYPKAFRYLKLAQACALYSQNLQYNLRRILVRKDFAAARLVFDAGVRNIYEIAYLLNDSYQPHDKWLVKGMEGFQTALEIPTYVENMAALFHGVCTPEGNMTEQRMGPLLSGIDTLAGYLTGAMRDRGVLTSGQHQTGGIYMEDMAMELAIRADFEKLSQKELVESVVKLEWEAFDKVKNEGGRADCQDDWNTFSVMRRSQYNVWTHDMLVQYATDFTLANRAGWNLITEKYGRMEKSTAPEEWERIKDSFPYIDDAKAAIIEEIVKIQVQWMEEFAAKYPAMAGNARSIHTSEDTPYDTSYETYLRGEISTYSDTMLSLYGQFIVGFSNENRNLAGEIMEQTALLYGYKSLEDAEERLK